MPLAIVLVAYLLGSVPTGVLLSRLVGIDPRQAGSGNIGATNVARTAGRWLGVLTLVGDASKGAVSVWLAHTIAPPGWLASVAGLAAISGHLWSCFLRLRGGKGVATAAGVFLILAPYALLVALAAFVLTAAVFRYVSLASMVAAAALPIGSLACAGDPSITLSAAATAAAIVGKHRDNLRRLHAGTEPKFGRLRPA